MNLKFVKKELYKLNKKVEYFVSAFQFIYYFFNYLPDQIQMLPSQPYYYQFQPFHQLVQIRQILTTKLIEQLNINQLLISMSQNNTPKIQELQTNKPKKQTKIILNKRLKIRNYNRNNTKKHIRKLFNNKISGSKNDTKNIPKNYGKAIMSFIQKNSYKIKMLTTQIGIPVSDFMAQVRRSKLRINSIADLRNLWGENDLKHPFKKTFRILSYQFMRKHCLMYIFKSRVKNYSSHIKYRKKIIEGIEKPSNFTNIKQY